MKKLYYSSVAIMMLALVSLSLKPVSANGVDEVLNNMRAAGKNIKSVRASLTQVKRDKSIGGPPERYSGTIVMQRGDRQGSEKVKIKYSNGQELAVVGEKITLYQPSINQVLFTTRQKIGRENKDISFVATPFASVDELKAKFDIERSGDDQGMAVLVLRPKNPNLQHTTIWVDKSNWLPVQFKLDDKKSKVESSFTLTQVSANAPVRSDEFTIKYPSGTKELRQ